MVFKNIHIIKDNNFFKAVYESFENNLPNQNFYVCWVSINDSRIFKTFNNILYTSLSNKNGILLTIETLKGFSFENIFLHDAEKYKIDFICLLKAKFKFKLYWFFYGYDLHSRLEEEKKLIFIDPFSSKVNVSLAIRKLLVTFKNWIVYLFAYRRLSFVSFNQFAGIVDFFCFWNEYDYKLLIENYQTNAQFKYFIYYGLLPNLNKINNHVSKNNLLINHNASVYGNHVTIFKKLFHLNITDKIICPINYGDSKNGITIMKFGVGYFSENIHFITEYLEKDKYFDIISNIKVAIFGHRRQEGAANIFALIYFGAKVFLRNDNSVLKWLKDRGFICFSFEDELNSLNDLEQLDDGSAAINRNLYLEYFDSSLEFGVFKKLVV
jgi:dTDP-N-acetylfucosamine:lipid II N-acetylfucosaminyltransferase